MSKSIIKFFLKKCFFASFILLCFYQALAKPEALVIKNTYKEYYVVRQYAEYFEDSLRKKTIDDISKNVHFKKISKTEKDFTNKNITSAYWLHFYVVNHTDELTDFILEMYDYDINEVDIYIKNNDGAFIEKKSGSDFLFDTRDFPHKNICFKLPIPLSDTTEIYMRMYSNSINIFEPVIKTHQQFYVYSLKEYVLLGIFYGFMVLIILYNFISFFILRVRHYIYYVVYAIGILIYLMYKNGTGFQYLWPNFPSWNYYIESLSLTISIVFLILFTINFLQLKKTNPGIHTFLKSIIILEILGLLLQIIYYSTSIFTVSNILIVQICFWVGYITYKNGLKSAKWFVLAFVFLNFFFLISWLEYMNWISSSIFTVYALNIGVISQFIFLSISITESIKDSEREKHATALELIQSNEKNNSMRLIELKKQMNPHFIFNALNSILERILTDKKEQAADFLIRFSKLIRKTLNYSDQIFIPLNEEIDFIENYLSLEQMRMGDTFFYTIEIDENLETDEYTFPSFILQPFIENAIWHGLLPKSDTKKIIIRVFIEDNLLHVTIEDNGIGRTVTSTQKENQKHKSKGISLVNERLSLIQLKYQLNTGLEITDLYDASKHACGTKVHIKIECNHE